MTKTMKLNFKKTLNDLEGKPLPVMDQTGVKIGEKLLSRNLANLLANNNTDDPIKF